MRGLLLALLVLFLAAGDCPSSSDVLFFNAINSNDRGAHLLWQAALQGDELSQQKLVELAERQGDTYWLRKLVSLNNSQAAWALKALSNEDSDNLALLKLAATGGIARAQLDYALSTDNPKIREKWLVRAAEQNFVPAMAALADWLLLHNEPQRATEWLAKVADKDAQSAFKYGRLLWDEGDKKQGKHYLTIAADMGNEQAHELIRIINLYKQTPSHSVEKYVWGEQECAQRIQMVGWSLVTMQRANSLYNAFVRDERLRRLPLCMAPPVWLEKNTVHCDKNWKSSGRLGCDIRSLESVVERRDVTHLVVIAQQGKANTDNGVMYLDISDPYSVFVHELAHFSGFIDEYPLSRQAAEHYCSSSEEKINQRPNLLFEGLITYSPMTTLDEWLQLAPGTGIWPSKTCEVTGIKSFKPSGELTFMEHHDSGVIPELYLKLWERRLRNPALQRPVSMNMFQSFHYAGNVSRAAVWLKRYESATNKQQPISVSP